MNDIIQKLENYSKPNLNQFLTEELPLKLRRQEFNLSVCYELWEKTKSLGFIDSSELLLEYMIKTSIAEKRIWMLIRLKDNLGKKNQKEKFVVENAIRDITTKSLNKPEIYQNIEILKIVEREIQNKNYFLSWIGSITKVMTVDELNILYLGVLIHGVTEEVAALILTIANKNNDQSSILKISQAFNFKKNKTPIKNRSKNELEEKTVNQILNVTKRDEDEGSRINLSFIDREVLMKYINDILFSLYCLRDYKNIYKIEEIIDLSFKKNPKEYQAYYFYKLTALLDQGKHKLVQSFIANEIFNLPLTKKELLPFMYLMAEALVGLKKYEDALNFYLVLQNDKQFELRSIMRINEIKKN